MQKMLLIWMLLSTACSSPRPMADSRPAVPHTTELTLSVGDPRVGSYVSSWHGFRTSSYWIEGPTGLILIDTQFLPSAAMEALNEAERVTGKKAVLAIVLHPNPDKFNGTLLYQKRGIRVVTSEQVRALIPSVHELRKKWFYDRYQPDYPAEVPLPESFGSRTTELSAGGIKVKAHVVGAGCSGAHVVVEFDRNVFVGDLVTIGFHSWMELGDVAEWLARLREIQALKPEYVRTGRGGTGDEDTLRREVEYLQTVQSVVRLVKSKHPKSGYSDAIGEEITAEMVKRYPAYEYPTFVTNGAEELWKKARLKI